MMAKRKCKAQPHGTTLSGLTGDIPRKCLKCGRDFMAVTKFNRLCKQCNSTNSQYKSYGILKDQLDSSIQQQAHARKGKTHTNS